MKNLSVPTLVACLCLVVAVSTSPGGWNGFKLPNLNPFAKKKKSPSFRLSDSRGSRSLLPPLPKINLLPKGKPGQPSTLQKINQNIKTTLSKTKDVLMPWAKKPTMPPVDPQITGSRRVYSGTPTFGNQTQKTTPSLVSKFLGYDPQEAPTRVNTTNDFLRLERPQYNRTMR